MIHNHVLPLTDIYRLNLLQLSVRKIRKNFLIDNVLLISQVLCLILGLISFRKIF